MNTDILFETWVVKDFKHHKTLRVNACSAEFALLEAARLLGDKRLADTPIKVATHGLRLGYLVANYHK